MSSSETAQARNPAFARARDLLANTMAVGITFFGTGPAYSSSVDFIQDFVSDAYGYELVGIASVLWFVMLAVMIFALSTLLVTTLVQITSLKSAQSLIKFR